MNRTKISFLFVLIVLLMPRPATANNCSANFQVDVGGALTQPLPGWQTASTNCNASAGCNAYFDIQVSSGDYIELSTCSDGGSVSWGGWGSIGIWSGNTAENCEYLTNCNGGPQISWTAPSTGTYRVRISNGSTGGAFTLAYNLPVGVQIVGGIPADSDGDGDNDDTDCNDSDSSIYTNAPETADDGIDQDCNGFDDITCIVDADGDSYGTDAGTTTVLSASATCAAGGASTTSDDCDDSAAGVNTGAGETADDGVDQDCNGFDDITCVIDLDSDTYGTSAGTTTVLSVFASCLAGGASSTSDDCDDSVGTVFPGATEIVGDGFDQDCNGFDAIACILDSDGDGYGTVAGTSSTVTAALTCAAGGASTSSDDCNDTVISIYPGATELIDDGIDQDCNGLDDITCIIDGDGDGYGTLTGALLVVTAATCAAGGASSTSDDCDDAAAGTYPSAAEVADDGVDQNCNGYDSITCFLDGDGDGYGTFAGTQVLVTSASTCTGGGASSTGDDCEDGSATVYPGAVEIADDNIDQDCNGVDNITCVVDGDGDGYGTSAGTSQIVTASSCAAGGASSTSDDCNDTDTGIAPGAVETCDAIDSDCDGSLADEFTDTDGDSEPDCTDSDDDGDQFPDAVDCAPTDASIYPNATEACDSIDSDCDGFLADGFDDSDGDDDPDCTDNDDDNDQYPDDVDCAPTDPSVHPNAAEACDAIDSDCDGSLVDEFDDGDADGQPDCIEGDADADGSPEGADCDDDDEDSYPGAKELCDGIDNDCDGTIDDEELDEDGDGESPCEGDCDDDDSAVASSLTEDQADLCEDGLDNDCDDQIDLDDPDCSDFIPKGDDDDSGSGDDDDSFDEGDGPQLENLSGGSCDCTYATNGDVRLSTLIALVLVAAVGRRRRIEPRSLQAMK